MTSPIHLFDLARRQNEWLSARQSIVASNIANANTPGYKTRDIKPFEDHLSAAGIALAAPQTNHLTASGLTLAAVSRAEEAPSAETFESGNSVDLEGEFGKSGDILRAFSLNTSVVKAFHRMMMLSAKV